MAALLNRRIGANTLTVLAAGGLGTYAAARYFDNQNALAESPASQMTSQPTKVFGRGPAFKYLTLHSEETVNHNTKRLRFELPGGGEAVSGLGLTCEFDTAPRNGCGAFANEELMQPLFSHSRNQKVAGRLLYDHIPRSAN